MVKSIARYLTAAIWLAVIVTACAPRPTVPLPLLLPPAQMPETGDRQAYRIAEDLATARSARAPEAFETFLAKFPHSPLAPRALMRLGELYQDRGRLEAAGDAYRRLLTDYRSHPLAPEALVALVAIDYQQEDFKALLVHSRILPSNRLEPSGRLEIRRLRIEALLALERPMEAAEEAIAAWQAAPDEEARATLADQLARAIGMLSPRKLPKLTDRSMPPEARDLLQRLVRDIAFDRHTIGCMLPLSGSHGIYGQRALRGVEMALMHFTARPTAPKVRMVIEDTRSRADQARAIVHGFSQRRVAAILGPMATAAEAAAEAQRQAIPIIAFTQREDVPALGDWVLRYFITPRNQVDALVRWALERDGIQRFAVLYPADRYGETFMARFGEAVEAYGATLVDTVAYDPASTDFAESIGRLAAGGAGEPHGAEALFIPDAPAKAALILPQLAFHDLTGLRLLGVNLWHNRSLIEMADAFAEGVVFPTGFFPRQADSATAAFIEEFKTAYGQEPGYIEAAAYDAAMILLEALSQAEVGSRARLLSFLKTQRPHAGLTGDAFFDARGELCQSLPLVTVRGGEFVLLDRLPLPSPERMP
ncbi:MAG TPA: tetratricopeptide repeat protein [Desulfobacteraceae bacterium]|nr:tetratricopeptide repeat protein [Desulfobacteraceae bacterium]